jgi:hypothetical protein
MTKKSEHVLKQDCVSSTGVVKKRRLSMAIREEHYNTNTHPRVGGDHHPRRYDNAFGKERSRISHFPVVKS